MLSPIGSYKSINAKLVGIWEITKIPPIKIPLVDLRYQQTLVHKVPYEASLHARQDRISELLPVSRIFGFWMFLMLGLGFNLL